MKIVMTLLAKDEEDIIRENIEYHLSQGIDYFIVTDNASKDSTTDILKEYEAKGVLKYIREEGFYSQSKWVTFMARMAHNELRADWVINNDADEFWWSTTSDNLKMTLEKISPKYSLVRAKRHNMLKSNHHKGMAFYKSNIYRRVVSLNPIGSPLPPKVCHRGFSTINVAAGAHQASADRNLELIDGKMEIFHYPVRNFSQLKSKTHNIGSGYENKQQIDPLTGRRPGVAQRTIYEEYKRNPDSLIRQYRQYTLSLNQLVCGLITGEIVKDYRLSNYLDKIMTA